MKNTKLFKLIGALSLSTVFLAGCTLSAQGNENSTTSDNADVTTITVGTAGMPAPYVTTNEDNEPVGYDIDVLKEIFNRLPQYELDLQLANFDAILTGVQSGNYDFIINNFAYNEDRAQSYLYSYPYNETRYSFIYNKETPVTSLKEAAEKGYIFEGNAGLNMTNVVEQYNEVNPDQPIKIEYTDADLPVIYQHLDDGVSDFRIDDNPVLNILQEEYGFDNIGVSELSEEDGEFINIVSHGYILFPKSEEGEDLRAEINEVIKEMAEDGTLAEISEEHFNVNQTPASELYEETIN
ncbi:transporter substrate-binding domain-containing protein [Jeotgalibaca sp. A127]|uniref:transporter substrate-binding domain-containing protein n=1 Tax=Jeotgalibaca sp. A127 TaxID=3457324 RepID=UPI003FCFFEDE